MPTCGVAAEAYDANGRRLNGNTRTIKADISAEAKRISASRQKSQVSTVRVETRVVHTSDK